jgi:hypothetical protein
MAGSEKNLESRPPSVTIRSPSSGSDSDSDSKLVTPQATAAPPPLLVGLHDPNSSTASSMPLGPLSTVAPSSSSSAPSASITAQSSSSSSTSTSSVPITATSANLDPASSSSSSSAPKSKAEEKSKILGKDLFVQQTEGGGDCAFHSILGEWDGSRFICQEVKEQRKELGQKIKLRRKEPALRPLIVVNIQEFFRANRIFSDRKDAASNIVLNKYREFRRDQTDALPSVWDGFQKDLYKYPEIKTYIESNQRSAPGATFKDKFYNVLAQKDNVLRGLIFSIPELEEAFRAYNAITDADFDWDANITEAVVEEYADFIARPGRWLLPSELQVMAYIYGKTVSYYTHTNAKVADYNSGAKTTVYVLFIGNNHFERMIEREHLLPGMEPDVTKRESPKTIKTTVVASHVANFVAEEVGNIDITWSQIITEATKAENYAANIKLFGLTPLSSSSSAHDVQLTLTQSNINYIQLANKICERVRSRKNIAENIYNQVVNDVKAKAKSNIDKLEDHCQDLIELADQVECIASSSDLFIQAHTYIMSIYTARLATGTAKQLTSSTKQDIEKIENAKKDYMQAFSYIREVLKGNNASNMSKSCRLLKQNVANLWLVAKQVKNTFSATADDEKDEAEPPSLNKDVVTVAWRHAVEARSKAEQAKAISGQMQKALQEAVLKKDILVASRLVSRAISVKEAAENANKAATEAEAAAASIPAGTLPFIDEQVALIMGRACTAASRAYEAANNAFETAKAIFNEEEVDIANAAAQAGFVDEIQASVIKARVAAQESRSVANGLRDAATQAMLGGDELKVVQIAARATVAAKAADDAEKQAKKASSTYANLREIKISKPEDIKKAETEIADAAREAECVLVAVRATNNSKIANGSARRLEVVACQLNTDELQLYMPIKRRVPGAGGCECGASCDIYCIPGRVVWVLERTEVDLYDIEPSLKTLIDAELEVRGELLNTNSFISRTSLNAAFAIAILTGLRELANWLIVDRDEDSGLSDRLFGFFILVVSVYAAHNERSYKNKLAELNEKLQLVEDSKNKLMILERWIVRLMNQTFRSHQIYDINKLLKHPDPEAAPEVLNQIDQQAQEAKAQTEGTVGGNNRFLSSARRAAKSSIAPSASENAAGPT